MKCPSCGNVIDGVVTNRISGTPGTDFPKTLKCVAYSCPKCDTILAVESDPDIRDSAAHKIQQDLSAILKHQEQEARKSQARAHAMKEIKN